MDYKEYQKKFLISKFNLVLGWCLLVISSIFVFNGIVPYFNFKYQMNDYKIKYVDSNYGTFKYELDSKIVKVNKIYNLNLEEINIEIPNHKTLIMACHQENNDECIYFDLNNPTEQSIVDPTATILMFGIFFTMGLYFVLVNSKKEQKNPTILPILILFISATIFGLYLLYSQISDTIYYLNLKNQNNYTTAKIYSEIYNIGKQRDVYKFVASYYVDGKEYIYVSPYYVDGTIEENYNKTFKIYYDQTNPSTSVEDKIPINLLYIITAIFLLSLSTNFFLNIKNKK